MNFFSNVPGKHNCHEPKFETNEILWVSSLNMTLEDRRIIEDEEWLSSDHMSSINQVLCFSKWVTRYHFCTTKEKKVNGFLMGKVSNQFLHH